MIQTLACWIGAWMLGLSAGWAAEVAGIKIAETASLDGQELSLNGAGVRTRLFVKVYVGALYLARQASTPAAVFGAEGGKRVSLHLLRDLEAERVAGTLNQGLTENHSAQQLAQLRTRIDEFNAIMNSIGSAKKGEVIDLDHLPGKGTRVSVQGRVKGIVPGDDFYPALLKVWLGDKPVDDALKNAMLGGR
ncbi:MAG TPA: chalcone isomerase family protein [Blastocatellia bacterium]|nr:chalcone isomerase family protein [Blastocatellia bacterium]